MSKRRNTNRKWSNMLSTKYRNHQHVDDTAHQEASNCKRYFYDKSYWEKMQRSDTNLYTHMTYAALQDNISETNRNALERLLMSFAEQEDQHTTLEDEVQVADTYVVDVQIDNTVIAPKIKSNKRKWLFGMGEGSVLVGVIAYVFKRY